MQQHSDGRLLAFPRFFIRLAFWVIFATLAACSGGGGGGGGSSAPVAADGILSVTEDIATSGVLQASDPSSKPLTFSINSNGTRGTAVITNPSTGAYTYTPNPNTNSTDMFTFVANNGTSNSNIATISVTIAPVNDAPVAVSDTYPAPQSGVPLAVSAPGVLANDTDPDGPRPTLASLVNGPIHASSFALNSDGSFTYTNNGNPSLTDSFTYRANDGTLDSANVVTVTLNINQPPVASNTCVSTARGVATGGFVSVTDEGGALNYQLVSGGTKGNVTLNSTTGQFTYTPCSTPGSPACTPATSGTGFVGMDKFTFRAVDQFSLQSAIATVNVFIDAAAVVSGGPGRVRIMPLGDSITAGITSVSNPLSADRIGYRKDLYDGLTTLSAGKYGIDFVGSLSDGSNFLSDTHHEGHPGWCDDLATSCGTVPPNDGIAETVISFLNTNPADVILLHIGINGFDASNAGINSILTNINTWAAANYPVTVLVARIIATTDGSLDVQSFNNNVAAIAATDRPYVKVFQVNQQAELDDPGNANPNFADLSLMGSVLHPNAAGYTKMANRWQSDLNTNNVLPSCP